MKKYILPILAIAISIAAMMYSTSVERKYQEYINTSEALLRDLEELCEINDIPWGDTICEGDSWSDYTDARVNLGLGELPYYKNVK